jgi:hypothetical protein
MIDAPPSIGDSDTRRFSMRLAFVGLLAASGLFAPQLAEPVAADELGAQKDRPEAFAQNDEEYAQIVEKYNDLLKQKRFDEAIIVAKQAQLLQPENLTSELMVLKAKYARQAALNAGEGLALARIRLDARLGSKIASIDRVCQLSDAQKQKLELAGRGDIKRLFDFVDSQQLPVEEGVVRDEKKLRERSSLLNADADALRLALARGAFEDSSLFAKTLKTTLTAEQAAAYDAAPTTTAAPPTPLEGSLIRWVDPVARKVWISRGEADGIQPRQIYRVSTKPQARRDPGVPPAGRADEKTFKGWIQITRVLEENLAEARIIEDDADRPIAKGDSIVPHRVDPN